MNRKMREEGTALEIVIGSQKQVSFTPPEEVNPKLPNKLLLAATVACNKIRLEQANLEDKDTLGGPSNYCSSNPNCFLPEPIVGPNDTFEPPTWFLKEITIIASSSSLAPTKYSGRTIRASSSPWTQQPSTTSHSSVTSTTTSRASSKHKPGQRLPLARILSSRRTTTPVAPPPAVLGFKTLTEILVTGMPYRYAREITGTERENEFITMLARGNHKSAQEERAIMEQLLSKDVIHGFSMVIPIGVVPLIPNAMAQPAGLVKHWTLDAKGNRKIKYRIAQDFLYWEPSKDVPLSMINSRIDMDQYPEMVYGWDFPRILHFMVALRLLAWPLRTIFIAKYDYSDAYQRIAHSALAAAQTIITCLAYAFVYFRMTFGGSLNPPTWCNFSEMVADLANEIRSMCKDWDPGKIRSPDPPVTPKPKRLASSIPHAPARERAVIIPTLEAGKVDVFIDDLIDTFPDSPGNLARKPLAVP